MARRWPGDGPLLDPMEHPALMAVSGNGRLLGLLTYVPGRLRFHQRRGFRLAALHRGGADGSRRRLKPSIPLAGSYGIPLHDELELGKQPGS